MDNWLTVSNNNKWAFVGMYRNWTSQWKGDLYNLICVQTPFYYLFDNTIDMCVQLVWQLS